ncbi:MULTISPECIES: HrcA family transcriptional regulator [unclassified Synechococcus]|uniref:HrcA family transcriptional regulator n=1 Tax=unclassified Synechococcus TaxID=2626047 RepID=UPI0025710E7C|nr:MULTISPECIES: HrcA family transcriptional regulator [unclassified Synechococcus]
MDTLPRRQQEVLRATVRHYVDTVEPVGSHTLVRRFGLPASPATVRTAMGALEQRGLLTQPHTSAGRIPSQRGYRLYVDQLLPAPGAAALQLERELAGISLQWAALDDLLLHLARRLADLTGLLSLITRPQRPSPLLQAVRLVPSGDRLLVFLVQGPDFSTSLNLRLGAGLEEELPILERWSNEQLRAGGDGRIPWERLPAELRRSGGLLRQALESHGRIRSEELDAVVAAGLGGLLAQPEFRHSSSVLPVVQLVEHGPRTLLGFTGAQDPVLNEAIWIGTEHPHAALGQCAVVQATYRTGHGGRGQVGLVGPMRMAYATARAAVQSVASILERLLS